MYKFVLLLLVLIISYNEARKITIDECVKKHSLKCLQSFAYKTFQTIIKKQDGNITLLNENLLEYENDGELEERQILLENYFNKYADKIINNEKRGFSDYITKEFQRDISEGRTTKRFIKVLLPILIGFKFQIVGLMGLAFIAIALLAKQATLAAVLSLMLSGYAAVKTYLTTKHTEYTEHHISPPPFSYELGENISPYSAPSFSNYPAYSSPFKRVSHNKK